MNTKDLCHNVSYGSMGVLVLTFVLLWPYFKKRRYGKVNPGWDRSPKIKLLAALFCCTSVPAPNLVKKSQSPITEVFCSLGAVECEECEELIEVVEEENEISIEGEINIVKSEDFEVRVSEKDPRVKSVVFFSEEGEECSAELYPTENEIPSEFSAQCLGQVCDYNVKPKMFVDEIRFGDARFSFTSLKPLLTAELLLFLRKNADHFAQFKGLNELGSLLLWLNRKGFAIYGGEEVVSNCEENLRRCEDWQLIRKRANEIRLTGDEEVL